MTATNHVLTGAAISLVVQNPLAAVVISFFSHFVLDLLPHYGRDKSPRFHKILIADGIFVAIAIVLALLSLHGVGAWLLFGCMFAAYAPDMIWIRYYLHARRNQTEMEFGRIANFLHNIQWGERPWLLPFEFVYAVLAVGFLIAKA